MMFSKEQLPPEAKVRGSNPLGRAILPFFLLNVNAFVGSVEHTGLAKPPAVISV